MDLNVDNFTLVQDQYIERLVKRGLEGMEAPRVRVNAFVGPTSSSVWTGGEVVDYYLYRTFARAGHVQPVVVTLYIPEPTPLEVLASPKHFLGSEELARSLYQAIKRKPNRRTLKLSMRWDAGRLTRWLAREAQHT